jgi:hypothetical protein
LKKRAANPKLTIQQAFEIAIQMESSEVNILYSTLTTPVHSSTYLLRRKIESSLPDHVERLAREGRKYGVSEVTLRKLGPAVDAAKRSK